MKMQYEGCFTKILYTYDEIQKRIKELAIEINSYYKSLQSEEILVLSILDGALMFTGQILPKLNFNIIFKTVRASVYGNKTYAKVEDLILDIHFDTALIKNKHILILEDLLDTGITLKIMRQKLLELGAKNVKICVLFKKDLKQEIDIKPDWIGLPIPNEWVAGFGIDSRDKYRNFKHLGIVKIEKR